MNNVVRITQNDDGEIIPREERCWHLVIDTAGSKGTLCTGELFGVGESSVVFEEKSVTRGGITCQECLEKIRFFKAVKL